MIAEVMMGMNVSLLIGALVALALIHLRVSQLEKKPKRKQRKSATPSVEQK